MPTIQIQKPTGAVETLQLDQPSYALGRSQDNQILLEGAGVSRHHGVLRREGERYSINDLNSHNGIYVNGRRIVRSLLEDDDQIRVGNYVLIYNKTTERVEQATMVVTLEEDYDAVMSQISAIRAVEPAGDDASTSFGQIKKERRTLSLLLELSRALSSAHSLEEVSKKAIELLFETTPAERGAIFLLEGKNDQLIPVTVHHRNSGEGGELSEGELPITVSSTIAARILNERRGIVTADAAEDPRFAQGQSVVAYGLRSIACAPLVGKEGNLGILYLENNRTVGAFAHEDLSLLCAVGGQVGLAVENARFYDALQRANEELEAKVEERTAALRKTQLQLYQSEKMASLNRLAAGIAHEMNTPLGALKANLELLSSMFQKLSAGPRDESESKLLRNLAEIAEESLTAGTRIMSVTQSLSSFARLDQAQYKVADINEGLEASVRLLDPSIRKNVEIQLDLGEIPPTTCYPALLNEAFMNLLVNGCQSIEEAGEVRIQSRADSQQITIHFRDTGSGIPPEVIDKVFDPGFTTRGVGVGMGLGLAIAYSIIKEHEGTIQVESELGKGSDFKIFLPISTGA